MRELVVILALLARSWRIIARIVSQRCAVPIDTIDELQALDKALSEFFTDPHNSLGPMMAQALNIGGDDAGAGGAGGASVAAVAAVPPPVQQKVQPVICPECGGVGKVKSRFMGTKDYRCGLCDGARMIWPVSGQQDGSAPVPVPAWGEEGADWYSKDQRIPPKGYADTWQKTANERYVHGQYADEQYADGQSSWEKGEVPPQNLGTG